MAKGWKLESARHSLARRGIETGLKSSRLIIKSDLFAEPKVGDSVRILASSEWHWDLGYPEGIRSSQRFKVIEIKTDSSGVEKFVIKDKKGITRTVEQHDLIVMKKQKSRSEGGD